MQILVKANNVIVHFSQEKISQVVETSEIQFQESPE
jgi:hypothetical protein